MGAKLEVKYFNTFLIKKTVVQDTSGGENTYEDRYGVYPGQPTWTNDGPEYSGNNVANPDEDEVAREMNYYIEEARIRGGYNNTTVDFGVKAYVTEDEEQITDRKASLIYSGIFNSRTGVNDTNVFSVGENITKSLDPYYGSIQKLHSQDNNLILLQESKSYRALIDKDTIYTAEGGTQTLPPGTVLGQIIPYDGDYGISRNPESFANFGFRRYYTDKDRGVVLRLSKDGLTRISDYGMRDYFRDRLSEISDDYVLGQVAELTTPLGGPGVVSPIIYGAINGDITPGMLVKDPQGTTLTDTYVMAVDPGNGPSGSDVVYLSQSLPSAQQNNAVYEFYNLQMPRVVGGWDIHNNNYVLSLQDTSVFATTGGVDDINEYSTLSYHEPVRGWVSFHEYKPIFMGSLKNKFYSLKDNNLWQHYFDDFSGVSHQSYYGQDVASSIEFIFNPIASNPKVFKTINYEGSNGWEMKSAISDVTDYYETSFENPNLTSPTYNEIRDEAERIRSYQEGSYQDQFGVYKRSGFNRKENKYYSELKNNSPIRPREVIFGPDGFGNPSGQSPTGIKGYFAKVVFVTDRTTNYKGKKELFTVSTEYVKSS